MNGFVTVERRRRSTVTARRACVDAALGAHHQARVPRTRPCGTHPGTARTGDAALSGCQEQHQAACVVSRAGKRTAVRRPRRGARRDARSPRVVPLAEVARRACRGDGR